MKTKMEDIDHLIKETLSEEEAKFYDGLEEQNLLGMVKGLYKGKNSWLVLAMNIFNLVVFGFLIYFIIQSFDEENTNNLIIYLGVILLCFITMSVIKIHMWMHMHRNVVTREIKRLELQVSSLAIKLSEKEDF
ncbi:hypothetical protein LX97_02415 [Nonlabens dokdonensis]|uniref:Uncharacterized protein n=2 Tax=Nonlabens dokdonensis TaxID=328515 RepID=L7W534_NONDD|nr:DUF6768 family protein [Nonlabens dokdonensis]AGC75209.1 hypothetical protein DDD_0082 [Nonlabens dokdonensis DSW-6]PZX39049.1 hypothetical protein LX97_02415 [Nonlabens dokdonensis]